MTMAETLDKTVQIATSKFDSAANILRSAHRCQRADIFDLGRGPVAK